MVIASSDSCNTLVSLETDPKALSLQTRTTTERTHYNYHETAIFLPTDDFTSSSRRRGIRRTILLPTNGRVDDFLKLIPEVVESADQLLLGEPEVFSMTSTTKDRFIYVGQGEVAHAIPSQCDVLVTDRATTCHILALRSESQYRLPLHSMAHIDSTHYESCIRSMIWEHIAHHHRLSSSYQEEKKEERDAFQEPISLSLHLLGGFEDSEGSSAEISNWLLDLLSKLAWEFEESIKMTLETCAISSLNDDGFGSPVGRGLAMDLRSGVVFLAQVDSCAMGPMPELRAVRNWFNGSTLSVIHTSRSKCIEIQPFTYSPLPHMEPLIHLPDHLLLQCTSTSPDVEEHGFCDAVRACLKFLLSTPCSKVFSSMDQPLIFKRCGTSNAWKRSD